ncbi:MAG: ATP-binding cassette domain-containing protein [Polyangiales bacterium]
MMTPNAAASPNETVIRFDNVRKAFGRQQVFRDLSLDVQRGEIIALIGGSGCGKSVLLKLILGLLRCDSGEVHVDGENISRYGERELLPIRRKVGMVFQNGALFDSLSVFDNIAYPLRERGTRDRAALAQRVKEVLEMVGLPGIERKMPAELSGGMRKRVSLARAVAEVPQIVLYDEPTTGLDPVNVRRISELIIELRDKLDTTSIVVTHDLASAYMVSDRMAMLAEGRVIAVDKTSRFRRSDNETVREFLTAMDVQPRSQEPPP